MTQRPTFLVHGTKAVHWNTTLADINTLYSPNKLISAIPEDIQDITLTIYAHTSDEDKTGENAGNLQKGTREFLDNIVGMLLI
jgi:hypothetical protein